MLFHMEGKFFLMCVVHNVGAVVEAKPVLVGISERVRSDVGAGELSPSVPSTTQEGGKRISTATNPAAEDAAELLRYIFTSLATCI